MGILKSLFTLGKSFISQAEESIEETQGVRMLEQHIRDAKAELDKAGKSRVDLLARTAIVNRFFPLVAHHHQLLLERSHIIISFFPSLLHKTKRCGDDN